MVQIWGPNMDHHGSTNPCDSYWVKKLKRDETGNIFFTLDFAAGILVHSDFMCRNASHTSVQQV